MIPPMRSDSCIPAIQFSLSTPAIPSTGTFTTQKLGKNGYVNKDYLIGGTTTYATRTVSVATGYLALRSAKAYDSSNEIGQLYSGDTVQLVDTTDAQYWYIYSQKLCKYGYVNKDYLY